MPYTVGSILFLESLVDFDFDNALTLDQLPESLQNKLQLVSKTIDF